jgi:hypothetical protein
MPIGYADIRRREADPASSAAVVLSSRPFNPRHRRILAVTRWLAGSEMLPWLGVWWPSQVFSDD